jgi:PTH1 family peptidyl-tRNA hydrolase
VRRLFGAGSAPVDWLVVGLGNPGERYARTPHNVGFAVADELARRWELPRAKQKYAGLFTDGRTGPGGPRVAVLWPQTYMNEAGNSVEVRTRTGGGLAGHNGLKSLRRGLGSPDFVRVRIGVGRPDSTDPEIVSAHVLGRWKETPDEVRGLVERAADAAERIVLGDAPP